LSFERAQSLRRIKPQRTGTTLNRRPDVDLPFLGEATPGPELLLDTCVYLDVLQGRTPPEINDLLQLRVLNHSTVALAELTHLFGRLDPGHADTRRVLASLSGAIDDMPPHRLTAPSVRCAGEAGMLAGLTARMGGRGADLALLNDASLFLQARETGCTILTRNLSDFDLFDQLLPGASLVLYRAV
jgi:predicted nucleic acid-binding protein